MVGVSKVQVLRRTAYKGGMKVAYTLPLDSASVVGLVLVLGCMLAAPALPSATVQMCRQIMLALEEQASPTTLTEITVLLPNRDTIKLDCNSERRFPLKELKPLFKKMGGNFAKFLWFKQHCFPMYLHCYGMLGDS